MTCGAAGGVTSAASSNTRTPLKPTRTRRVVGSPCGVGVVALAGNGCEDGERAGAFADLAGAAVLGGDGLPGAVAGDASFRALGDEQQDVAGGVGVEAAAHLEHRRATGRWS